MAQLLKDTNRAREAETLLRRAHRIEKKKDGYLSHQHLIVGLGGTGGKIIRAFRKTIFQEFRAEHPDRVNVEYLYVDSSSEMMSLDDPSWKILGKSVQLGKHQQLLIQGTNLSAQLDNINSFPGIKNWIGSKDQWQDILNSIVGEVLGGQKRRLGRFLFSCKVKEFRQQVQNLARELQQKGSTPITFHICCGLAGGTGSGSLVDVISQIRDMFPDSRMHRIIVYALLPDTFPKPNWDTGNYHANGYAALMELNSLSVGAWEPHDVSGNKDRLKLRDPFNGCYLFNNENENGLAVDIGKDIPSIVADFLYQKLIAVDELSWSTLSRMENAENGDGTPECAAGTRKGERSKRFLSFSIKRLVVPEEEIWEYMTYNFARQTTLQLLYNNWSDSIGFLDEARNHSFREFVGQQEVQLKWLLTDEHLCLSMGILPDEICNKKWKPINVYWQEIIPIHKEVVRQKDSKTWLNELGWLCEKHFDQDYRGSGVRKFYENKASTYKVHARQIRERIESDLFEEWKDGSRSVHEIGELLDALLMALEGRLKEMDEKAAKARENAEEAARKILENSKEWEKIGILSAAMGKRDRLLDAQATCLQEHYVRRTRFEGWQYARGLVQKLIFEVTSLRNEVASCARLVIESVKAIEVNISERCAYRGQADLRRPLIHFYNRNEVKDFTRRLLCDKSVQHVQANDVRLAIVEQLGETPDFTSFNARISLQRLIEILEARCEEGAVNGHNNLIAGGRHEDRLFGVNIIEKLYKEYGSNEQHLRSFIYDLVSSTGSYLVFDPLEANKVGPGVPTSASKVCQFTVILPKAPEWVAFSTTLKDMFRCCLTSHTEIIESDDKSNQIALISVTNLFPLRFVKQVEFLKKRYDARIGNRDSVRNKFELHCEGDGLQHPRLFIASAEDLRREELPFILLAKAPGIIQQKQSRKTGKTELVLLTKDADGFDNLPVNLGLNLVESVDKLDLENIESIRPAVQRILDLEYLQEDKQVELRRRIVNEVDNVKVERNNDVDDPIYKRFLEAGKRAAKIVGKEG